MKGLATHTRYCSSKHEATPSNSEILSNKTTPNSEILSEKPEFLVNSASGKATAEEEVCSTKVISPLKQTPCEEEVVPPPNKTSFLNKKEVDITPVSCSPKQYSCMEEVVITKVVPPSRTVLNSMSSEIVVNTKVVPAPKKPRNTKNRQILPSSSIRRKNTHSARAQRKKAFMGLCPQCPVVFPTRQSLALHLKSDHPLQAISRERKTKKQQETTQCTGSENATTIVTSLLLQIIETAIQTAEALKSCKELEGEFIHSPDLEMPATPPSEGVHEVENLNDSSLPSTPSPCASHGTPTRPSLDGIIEEDTLNESYLSPTSSLCASQKCEEPRPMETPIELLSSSHPVSVPIYLVENNLVRVPTRGDGLCIIRAAQFCLQHTTNKKLSKEDLSSILLKEVQTSKEKYSIHCLNTPDVVEAMKEYLYKKNYMSEIADIVIDVLANALSIRVKVITEEPTGHTHVITIAPHLLSNRGTELILLRSDSRGDQGTHYDSVIPEASLSGKLQLVSMSEGERILRCPITSQKYLFFQYPSQFSNLYKSEVKVDGTTYNSVEQGYQSVKFTEGSLPHTNIMSAKCTFEIKRLGKQNPTCSPPPDIMDKALFQKFTTEGPQKNHLLQYKDCILVESTTDTKWGIGRNFSKDKNPSAYLYRSNWIGSNMLGKKIMRIRSDLIRSSSLRPSKTPRTQTSKTISETKPSAPTGQRSEKDPRCSSSPQPAKPGAGPSHAWTNPPSSIKEAPKPSTSVKVTKVPLKPLPVKAFYLPPSQMSSKELIRLVTSERPEVGRHLTYHKGKVTSSSNATLKALKTPLLPSNNKLCMPLKRYNPSKSVESIWLSSPVPRKSITDLQIAGNPRVVHVMKHEENSTHIIWKVTTAFEGVSSSTHKEPNYLETDSGVLTLVPYTPITRCTFCQSINHTKEDCFAEHSSCVFCAGCHPSTECTRKDRPKCARCLGPHKASNPICREIQSNIQKQRLPVLPNSREQSKQSPRKASLRDSKPNKPSNLKSQVQSPIQSQFLPSEKGTETTKNGFFQSPPGPSFITASKIPSLFQKKFTAHQVEQLFSPAAYLRISKNLFPSLVSHSRSDRTQLPSVATSFIRPSEVHTPLKTHVKLPRKKTPIVGRHEHTHVTAFSQRPPYTPSFKPTTPNTSHSAPPFQELRRPSRYQTDTSPTPTTQPLCPVAGYVADIPQFLVPFISHLHDILRQDMTHIMLQQS